MGYGSSSACMPSYRVKLIILDWVWMRVRKKAGSGINTIKYHTWPGTAHGKVTKTQENITDKRAKRLAL